MDNITFDISIPTDDDGFILFQCPKCGEYFKLLPADVEKDDVMDIYCPLCGVTSENFFTEDVKSLALAKAKNKALDELYGELKKIERKTKNSVVKIKVEKPIKEEEVPIRSTVDALEIVELKCCNRLAKIRYLLNYSGYHCPYCGGSIDGIN